MSGSPPLSVHSFWRRVMRVLGPGIVVMLADTDVGSVITAAQSGAKWGYELLLLQVVLIPILYIVQELTVRLGLVTGKGHGELIRARFGRGWGWLSASTLVVACIGAIVTQFSGIAGVAQLFGVPVWLAMCLAGGGVIAMVLTGSYRSVEGIAIFFGLFELAFLFVAWEASPSLNAIVEGIARLPLGNGDYLYLAAANVGAVIMPWMVFYQQSAVVDRRLVASDMRIARWDTVIGAFITQIIMGSVLVATAATIGSSNVHGDLNDVPQITRALTPFLGETVGRIIFAVAISGAALVATIVVSLAAAWGIGEVAGYKHSLEHHPREAPWFYGIMCASIVASAVLVASGVNLVRLSVAVEVMNACLLPIVLGFLFLLARYALVGEYRLRGLYAWFVGFVIILTSGFGLYAGLSGAFSG